MKAGTWIIIVLSICLTIAILFSIIFCQAVMLKFNTQTIALSKSQETIIKLTTQKKIRDEYLNHIKVFSDFNQRDKIKLELTYWKQMKESEK